MLEKRHHHQLGTVIFLVFWIVPKNAFSKRTNVRLLFIILCTFCVISHDSNYSGKRAYKQICTHTPTHTKVRKLSLTHTYIQSVSEKRGKVLGGDRTQL